MILAKKLEKCLETGKVLCYNIVNKFGQNEKRREEPPRFGRKHPVLPLLNISENEARDGERKTFFLSREAMRVTQRSSDERLSPLRTVFRR